MTKQEVKQILKAHGYRMIGKSWYETDDTTGILFNAYKKSDGWCYQFYVNKAKEYAMRTVLTTGIKVDHVDVDDWFFGKEARA